MAINVHLMFLCYCILAYIEQKVDEKNHPFFNCFSEFETSKNIFDTQKQTYYLF